MDDLTLVGVHEDGEHLLLVSTGGQRFRMRVDEAVRAAVRRDRARLGQLQNELDGGLRPREIQARIRSGESADEVAASSGVPVEHIRRYEGPVLAERGFVADQARKIRVRRSPATTATEPETLDAVVSERLGQRDVDPDGVNWDAWRADEGSWTVTLAFRTGDKDREARWSYDPGLRHVVPIDDEARWLTEHEQPADPSVGVQRRLAPVRDRVFDLEAGPDGRPAPEDHPAIDLLETLRERRGRRSRPTDDTTDGDGDPVREAIDSMLNRSPRKAEPAPAPAPEAQPVARGEIRPEPRTEGTGGLPERRPSDVLVLPDARPGTPSVEGSDEEADDERAVGVGSRRPVRKQRRPSVPSWDDIVFGQRRD